MNSNKVLITGSAGFIGFHLADILIKNNFIVYGIDIINEYYDVNLKFSRLQMHGIEKNEINNQTFTASKKYTNYYFLKQDIANHDSIVKIMKDLNFDYVINLAAQAGVRYSMENPRAYTHSNIDGFLSILEGCRLTKVKHLIYASTSSVYGLNTKMPLNENDTTEHPMAIYAASKKANEMMAHSYSHLYNLPTTGLRFFTVYGPWGRPDMALFLFTDAILKDKPINVFNHGKMIRDFTYVDDIVISILKLIKKPASSNEKWSSSKPSISTSSAPYQIFNIGNGSPVLLTDYIFEIENSLGKKASLNMMDIQPGDVPETHADCTFLSNYINFQPNTPVSKGVNNFIRWYLKFYNIHD